MWHCTGMKQYSDKLNTLKKKYKEVVDGLRRSGVSVESNNDTMESDWTDFTLR